MTTNSLPVCNNYNTNALNLQIYHNDVVDATDKLKNDKWHGIDDIPTEALKQSKRYYTIKHYDYMLQYRSYISGIVKEDDNRETR